MAVVYSQGAGGGYTTVEQPGLPCGLGILNPGGVNTVYERAELGQARVLYWSEDYTMPEHAQLEIDGERWNVVAGSVTAVAWPFTGTVVYRSCDVRRAT